jgi:hypothetical protein
MCGGREVASSQGIETGRVHAQFGDLLGRAIVLREWQRIGTRESGSYRPITGHLLGTPIDAGNQRSLVALITAETLARNHLRVWRNPEGKIASIDRSDGLGTEVQP